MRGGLDDWAEQGPAVRRAAVAAMILLLGCRPAPSGSTATITRSGWGSERATTSASAPVTEPSAAGDEGTDAPRSDWRAGYEGRPAIRTLQGRVSYYHDSLAGNSTASGEPYDPSAFTAANRDLPFGTVIRVVREDTGASVIVRVNDRGPFGRARRLLDLSRAAAEELDMISRGVVEVRAEILEMGEPRGRRRPSGRSAR